MQGKCFPQEKKILMNVLFLPCRPTVFMQFYPSGWPLWMTFTGSFCLPASDSWAMKLAEWCGEKAKDSLFFSHFLWAGLAVVLLYQMLLLPPTDSTFLGSSSLPSSLPATSCSLSCCFFSSQLLLEALPWPLLLFSVCCSLSGLETQCHLVTILVPSVNTV